MAPNSGDHDLGSTGYGDAQSLERELLVRRLDQLTAGGPATLLSYVLAALLLVATLLDADNGAVLLGWAATVTVMLLVRVVHARRIDLENLQLAAIRRKWRQVQVFAMITSSLWALMIPYFAIQAEGVELTLTGMIVITVLMGTLFYRAPPPCGQFHVVVLLAGLFVGGWLVAGYASFLTAAFAGFLGVTLLSALTSHERAWSEAVESDLARADTEATVRILLDDYEEHSSDWQWTVGADGTMRGATPRFAQAAGRSVAEMEGKPLISLFQPGETRDRLARHLLERSPFRDLLLSLRSGSELQYWRLSARPRSGGVMSGVARDVTQDRLIEERVAFMAHFDNLTGLANRHLFNERLRKALGSDGSRDVALFYLDLDDFKAVNDTRGHQVGDRLLREVAARLEQEVRPEDLVARLGGDEFAILIQARAGAGMLMERAHRFLSVVREPYEIDGQLYRISTSVGIARCNDGRCDAEELLRRADLALFAAKAKGRDNLAIFDHELDRAARDRRTLEADLREAIARGQLRLHYQPIIELETGRTTGYEALLRWYHPHRGIIAPGEFLAIAEETGMIVPMGEWVIRQALTETAGWPTDLRIAINLSPTQVRSSHLVAVVAQALHINGIAAERIEFEITEHVLLQQNETSHATLLKLRELGARIALDDFGVGYSSLGYLRSFPFDRIKIDRHFVQGIENSADSQAIVSAITRLADALGMSTTAEGIESRDQLDLLRKLGCNEAQGFLICEPVPGERLHGEGDPGTLVDMGADVLDYRRARNMAARRNGSRVA